MKFVFALFVTVLLLLLFTTAVMADPCSTDECFIYQTPQCGKDVCKRPKPPPGSQAIVRSTQTVVIRK